MSQYLRQIYLDLRSPLYTYVWIVHNTRNRNVSVVLYLTWITQLIYYCMVLLNNTCINRIKFFLWYYFNLLDPERSLLLIDQKFNWPSPDIDFNLNIMKVISFMVHSRKDLLGKWISFNYKVLRSSLCRHYVKVVHPWKAEFFLFLLNSQCVRI